MNNDIDGANADVAKCAGFIYGCDGPLRCCARESCLRYLRPSAVAGQAWLAFVPTDDEQECPYYERAADRGGGR